MLQLCIVLCSMYLFCTLSVVKLNEKAKMKINGNKKKGFKWHNHSIPSHYKGCLSIMKTQFSEPKITFCCDSKEMMVENCQHKATLYFLTIIMQYNKFTWAKTP